MIRTICEATRKDGRSCQAPALSGSRLCWSHDPRQAEMAARARADGGAKAGRLRALRGRRSRLDHPRALAAFLSHVIHDVVEGRQDPEVAKVVFYGCSVQRAVVELVSKAEVERRLSELERLIAQRRHA